MAGLREIAPEGEPLRIYAISPDTLEQSRAFVEKIERDGKGKVAFSLLADPQSRTIDRYALRDPAYAGQPIEGIPHPAVFVLDRKGRIRWLKVETDYRQRPSNEEIRAALDRIP